MLRHQQNEPWRTTAWRTRLAAVSAVAAAALLVAGLRGPAGSTALAQTKPLATAAGQPAAAEKFSLKFVPAEAVLVAAIRPADLLAEPGIGDFVKKFDWAKHVEEHTGVPLAEVDEVTVVVLAMGENIHQSRPVMIVRSRQALDWKPVVAKLAQGQVEIRDFGGTSYQFSPNMHPTAAYVADERTLIAADEPQMRLMITMAQGGFDGLPGPSWADEWQAQPAGQARLAVNVEAFKAATGFDPARMADQHRAPGDAASVMAALAPLVTSVQSVVGSAQVNGGMKLSAVATTGSGEAAANVAETLAAVKTLLKNLSSQMRQALLRQPHGPPGVPQLLAMVEDLLAKTEIKAEDKLVKLSAASRYNGAMAAAIFMPAVAAARQAAQRTQDANQLKQFALAMHNYADANQSGFPPAVLYGPDGKTPYSWRVAILPYIEQDALYRQYNFNEPWDSPANRRVLEQMPALFRSPGDDPRSTSSSYFVLTGPETIFSGKEGAKFQEITDGTSNTLLIVETRRDIPWTKPEDIPYESGQPLPKLGGYTQGGFNAAFADGSVRFLHEAIDEKMLRALITKAGGEPINAVDGPPPARRTR